MAKHIVVLWGKEEGEEEKEEEEEEEEKNSHKSDMCGTDQLREETLASCTSSFEVLECIDFSISLQSLQLRVDTKECS